VRAVIFLLFLAFNTAQVSGQFSDRIQKKVNTHVERVFQLTDGFTLNQAESYSDDYPLYSIMVGDEKKGYAFVDQAPSMKNIFDYMVLLDPDLQIVEIKVLIYREQHGKQIAAKRWLKQFFGLGPKATPALGEDIDGISGATISARNMTVAVKEMLAEL